jgi:hypothetical protein
MTTIVPTFGKTVKRAHRICKLKEITPSWITLGKPIFLVVQSPRFTKTPLYQRTHSATGITNELNQAWQNGCLSVTDIHRPEYSMMTPSPH